MIENLTYEELRDLITCAQQRRIFHSVEEIMITEANIFLCDHQGMRVDFKFDLAYGIFVEPSDEVPLETMEELRRVLEAM